MKYLDHLPKYPESQRLNCQLPHPCTKNMPDYNRGTSAASEDDETIRPETTVETITTAGATTSGLDQTSISEWVTAQSEVEDPEDPNPSGSSKNPVRDLELHFFLPCGNGESYSTDKVVLRGPSNRKFKMRDILVSKNPNILEAFVEEHYNDVSELTINFHIGKSENDNETRKQMVSCLEALVPLVTQCSFTITSEYTMASKPPKKYDSDGEPITLNDIIVERFKNLAGHMPELKVSC